MATNYVVDFLNNMSADGMTDDLWELVREDSKKLGKVNVCNDKQRNLYFYLDHFCDDVCKEFNCKIHDREDVVNKAFDYLKDKDEVDLVDIRKGFHRALKAPQKVAYPNVSGVVGLNTQPKRDVSKWIEALGEIHHAISEGEDQETAKKRITEGWDPMAKLNFDAWTRYYEHNDHEKYAMRKTADPCFNAPMHQFALDWLPKKEEEAEQEIAPPQQPPIELDEKPRRPGRPRKKTRTPEDSRRALIGRLDSADKLLREFASVWPAGTWNRLHAILSDLKREIMMLKSEATMTDCIIRTANRWGRAGFLEGADFLMKIAQPPQEDVTDQIEKALTGREYETGAGEAPPEEAPMEMSPEEMEAMPPAGAAEELPPPEEPPAAEMPPAEEAPVEEPPAVEEPPEAPSEHPDVDGNPYEGTTVEDVIKVLEPLVTDLKVREAARELSKVDMMLDAQNIASHFPELGEAMNKTLEANTYIVTRLDKMLTKLKGGIRENEEEQKPESVDMGEITGEPPVEGLEVEEPAAPEAVPEAAAPEAAPQVPEAPAPPATASKKEDIIVLSSRG